MCPVAGAGGFKGGSFFTARDGVKNPHNSVCVFNGNEFHGTLDFDGRRCASGLLGVCLTAMHDQVCDNMLLP